MWSSTILLALVSILSAITFIYFSSYKWHGMKIISRRDKDEIEITTYRIRLIKAFNSWWNLEKEDRKFR